MRRFNIIANITKDPDGIYTEQIKNQIIMQGGEITEERESADAIIVLGGDGTLLRAAGDTIASKKPLLGVNIGTLGYLAEADMSQIESAIEALINDTYSIDERMMLFGYGDNAEGHYEDHSLNDVSITGCGALSIIRYELFVNGELLNNYAADGLIISTPTGSTGYNMSAGGPIVDPTAKLLVVTPICPHTLNTRSIVLSADADISVKICDSQRTPVAIQFDGREPHIIGPGDIAHIRKSEQITRIIKLHRESFLNTLHDKLK